ncbi:unnamed protein product [Bathycoccus prasinos]
MAKAPTGTGLMTARWSGTNRSKRESFRAAGVLPPVILNVALNLLRHFFFLESTGQLASRVSQRIPWQEITKILQEAFPVSRLAQIFFLVKSATWHISQLVILNHIARDNSIKG